MKKAIVILLFLYGYNVFGQSKPKQLNITILTDLSDRIDPAQSTDNPPHWERDIANVQYICELFKQDVSAHGAFMAKGKIRVIFEPTPNIANIGTLAQRLVVDFANIPVKEKKAAYDKLTATFTETLTQIYKTSIKAKKWDGSDIWRFFKNGVKQYCIDPDPAYRNILIILTDGYIYHSDSKMQTGNRYTYLLSANIAPFRSTPNWQQQIKNKGFGLIAPCNGLSNLEVLVLDITPLPKHNTDEDILRFVIGRWLQDMGVKRHEIHLTDFPVHIKPVIKSFISNN
jgi:hypothetical protein